jgi:hypothetical protein
MEGTSLSLLAQVTDAFPAETVVSKYGGEHDERSGQNSNKTAHLVSPSKFLTAEKQESRIRKLIKLGHDLSFWTCLRFWYRWEPRKESFLTASA